MRLTLLTSAIAAVTFVATLAFAPAIADVGERLGSGQSEVERLSVPQEQVFTAKECRTSLQVVVVALGHKDCK
jgi:hypothetical protein